MQFKVHIQQQLVKTLHKLVDKW